MKLTVLGGSAAGPNTGAGCSGYLIESGETRMVLDLGPGTLPELRRHADFRALDAIIVSHYHLDHVLDLASLRFALAYNPVPPPRRLPLWLPPGGLAELTKLAAAFAESGEEEDFFERVFSVREYDPGATLAVGDLTLSFAPTVHYVPGWAMRVERFGEGALAYTADTGPAARLGDLLDGSEVVIAESTLLEPSAEAFTTRGHLTAREAGRLAATAKAATLVLAHYWEELGVDRLVSEAAVEFEGRIEAARPGLMVEW